MRRSVAVGIVLVALASGVQAQPLQLPEGEGRELLIETCVQCHDLRPVVTQRKSPESWQRTVHEMIWRGAPLYPGEALLVARYLAQAFGEDAGPPAPVGSSSAAAPAPAAAAANEEAARSLPAGEGRELLLAACVQCHSLETTTALRKSAVEWRHSVELMVAVGARLNGRDQETLIAYLASALGEE